MKLFLSYSQISFGYWFKLKITNLTEPLHCKVTKTLDTNIFKHKDTNV